MFSKILSMQFMQLPIRNNTYLKVTFGYIAGLILFIFLFPLLLWAIASILPYWFFYVIIGLVGVFMIYTFGASFYFIRRRLQTLGYSTNWMFLLFFPILFIILIFVLMFPGDEKIIPTKDQLNRKQDDNLTPTTLKSKVWKTIKLGTGLKNADAFRKALKSNSFSINNYANDILGKSAFTVTTEEVDVDLANVSVGELGLKEGAQYKDICARGLARGLKLCPAEVGPQLRLQYKDQLSGDDALLRIAMEAIGGSNDDQLIFGLSNDRGELCLLSFGGLPECLYAADGRFVFVLPRN